MSAGSESQLETSRQVVAETMETGAVLIHTATGECFELNRTGLEVWDAIRRSGRVTDVVDGLVKRYGLGVEKATADVQAVVAQLVASGLVIESSP